MSLFIHFFLSLSFLMNFGIELGDNNIPQRNFLCSIHCFMVTINKQQTQIFDENTKKRHKHTHTQQEYSNEFDIVDIDALIECNHEGAGVFYGIMNALTQFLFTTSYHHFLQSNHVCGTVLPFTKSPNNSPSERSLNGIYSFFSPENGEF